MNIDFNKHKKYKDKIDEKIYQCLEILALVSNKVMSKEAMLSCDLSILKTIKMVSIDEDNLLKDKVKASIYYIRICTIIDSLSKEYENYDDDFKKSIISYYVLSNSMKELNTIGFGWYYDMKYKKNTATLYSVGYGESSNWYDWLERHFNQHNQIKERGMQLIFHGCKEHINRGGTIRLKSLSKCFGVDLFKYMQLDSNNLANLYIIKDATVNFIEYENNTMALQEYILSHNYEEFDAKKKPDFCLDFSHPRNEMYENYNTWSKSFLQEAIVSQAEFNNRKKDFGIQDNGFSNIILQWLQSINTKNSDKAISSRISPIADQEVIVSKNFWEIQEYTNLLDNEPVAEKCYHFQFSELEYCQLIFAYFKNYYEHRYNGHRCFDYCYDLKLKDEKNSISENIIKLEEENKLLLSQINIQSQVGGLESRKPKIDDNCILINLFTSYKDFLDSICTKIISPQVQFALSFVDWNIDEIPDNWSLENIYMVKQNEQKNLMINLYKCLCKIAALV